MHVTANFFNSNGGLVYTSSGYVYLNHTQPSQINCFDITLFSPPANWSYYELERPTYHVSSSSDVVLTIFNDSGQYDPPTLTYTVIGQVRNDGPTHVRNVEAVATLFDENNVVMGCQMQRVNSDDLDPGQTSSFMVTGYGTHFSNVARYHVATDGDPQ